MLTGACLARSGLNRRAAYATLTMVAAAEFPDIDTLWGLRSPVADFEHHRGITHTFLGLPFEAALIVALVYGLHRWRVARAASPPNRERSGSSRIPRPLTAAPVRWAWLYGLSLLALLSHLLLDYTNNYGLRPFYPFNPHWYAASIVFIFDPLMFAMLLLGLGAPVIFGLVSSEVGAQRQPFSGRGWAIAALCGVLALWTLREVEHTRALRLAMSQSIVSPGQSTAAPGASDAAATGSPNPASTADPSSAPGMLAPPEPPITYLAARRALANPDPLSPFRWPSVIDFGPVYRLAEIDTRNAAVRPGETLEPKPGRDPAVLAAEASPLGRFYMNWSPMPFISVSHPGASASAPGGSTLDGEFSQAASGAAGLTSVTFRDPRFMGRISMMPNTGRSPLSATVVLDSSGHVVRQSMGNGTP